MLSNVGLHVLELEPTRPTPWEEEPIMLNRSPIRGEFASHRLKFLVCAAKEFNLDMRGDTKAPRLVSSLRGETGVRSTIS